MGDSHSGNEIQIRLFFINLLFLIILGKIDNGLRFYFKYLSYLIAKSADTFISSFEYFWTSSVPVKKLNQNKLVS